jgi:predicted ATPase/DNA-binding winged helix-turn-helix (wHTH) protein
MVFAFANCEIDVERRELRRDGRTAHVEPQVFDVLLHLIKHRDRVVGKDELLGAVWDGRIVSEATLSSRISAARRAIGDTGQRQIYVSTIARRGFRFCGEVEERGSTRSSFATSLLSDAVARSSERTNLPSQPTRLLGRDRDLAEVAALFAARLVTLTGVGGVGKTRLAIHVAAEVAPNYPDGAWLVEFAAVGDPGATGHAVAGVLGVLQQPGKTIEQSVVNALRGRYQLLVLDNCEHLIQPIAALARDILASCPHVTLLATSREALMVEGEQSWPVPPLGFDGISSPAVQLFVERARAVAPGFALGADCETVGDICRLLDGIPLAIELAAARIRAMSPSQIRDRLSERFQLLTGGSRRAVERHQTLHHAVQWSYDLLSPAERAVLARTSAFAGGFTLEAAERVCAGAEVAAVDVLDVLDSLVRKSLVTVERSGNVVRYGMLETIRQFAEEQQAAIDEREAVRIRHARYFAEDSDAHFKIWHSPRQLVAYEWLDREMANLRAAFRWASERGEVDIAARIASNIGDMARNRVRDEAANWAAEVVDAARLVRHRRLAVLLSWAASSAWSFGRLEEAKRYGEEAISLARNADFDPFVEAFIPLAVVALYEGDVGRAIELARAGAANVADRHDRTCLAFLLQFLTVGGRSDEAMTIADKVVSTVDATGVPASIIVALRAKGRAFAATDPAEALASFERAIAIAYQSGNRKWEIMTNLELAALQARSGDLITALRSFRRMLDLWLRSTDLVFVSHGLGGLIVLFDRLGRAAAAATLNGTLTKTFASNPFVAELPATVARMRDTLGDAKFEEANRRGAAMPLHEAHDYARDQVQQALAVLGVGAADH